VLRILYYVLRVWSTCKKYVWALLLKIKAENVKIQINISPGIFLKCVKCLMSIFLFQFLK
jgi:hypothetical protein